MKEIRITPTPHYMGFGYDIRIIDYGDANGHNRAVGKSIVMESITTENEHCSFDPIMNITRDELQKWLDEIWTMGIRPSNGAGDGNAIEAIKYHLEDMRSLVFKRNKK